MTIDKQKLKALAEAATQGEWSHERFGVIQAGPVIQFANGSGRQQIAMATGADWMVQGEQIANAEFMAAANPSVVLALLAEIERLEAESRDAKDAKIGLGWAVNELRGSFKNFHRSLCARFGYTHDEKDWFRDQVSLEEHVAGQIDQLKAENETLRKRVADDERKLDALLAHCGDGECGACGQIICPHGDSMHFHHDGCPSCAQHEAATVKDRLRVTFSVHVTGTAEEIAGFKAAAATMGPFFGKEVGNGDQ